MKTSERICFARQSAQLTRLPPDKFVRISRSVIVNVDRVKELEPLFYCSVC